MKTTSAQINQQLIFQTKSGDSIKLEIIKIKLAKEKQEIKECQLIGNLDLALYQQIENQELFQLQPQLKGRISSGEFNPNLPLTITIYLEPELLPNLEKQAAGAKSAANYLLKLGETQPDTELLQTDNWFTLTVKQQQPNQEITLRTFWDYLNIPQITTEKADITEDLLHEAMLNFCQDTVTTGLVSELPNSVNQEETIAAANQLLSNLFSSNRDAEESEKNTFQGIADSLSLLESLIPSDITEIIQRQTLNQEEVASLSKATSQRQSASILTEVKSFFENENWSFEDIENQNILRMFFQGENGQWLCVAEVKAELEQFIFSSISNTKAPEMAKDAVASLLMRFNCDLTIGNFELDFSDGEIHFRTSIDVRGSRLDEALIKNLVYTNVLTMDKYLPEINRLIEGKTAMSKWFSQIPR